MSFTTGEKISNNDIIIIHLSERLRFLCKIKSARNGNQGQFNYIINKLNLNEICLRNCAIESQIVFDLNFDQQYKDNDEVLNCQILRVAKLLKYLIHDAESLRNLDAIIAMVSN